MSRARAFWFGSLLALAAARANGAGPVPVIFQSAPGRFEVAAIDATAAQAVVTRAEEAWRWLAGPLALPAAFSSPVFVRLVPAADWKDSAEFRVTAEAGGVVSVRLRWGETVAETVVRRALVQSLLMRIGVANHGASKGLLVPRWLEEACLGWWRTHDDAAQLDALKQESSRFAPPALADLLAWQSDEKNLREFEAGATWLLVFLQEESARTDAWPKMLNRLLGGAEPLAALKASFPGRSANDAERELWWETGWHHARRDHTLPTLEAAESRAALAALARVVVTEGGHDVVAPLQDVLAHWQENAVSADLRRRATALNRLLPTLHPFYRNAGLSLAEVLAARGVSAEHGAALCASFDRDWRDATELEMTTVAALDALERSQASASGR